MKTKLTLLFTLLFILIINCNTDSNPTEPITQTPKFVNTWNGGTIEIPTEDPRITLEMKLLMTFNADMTFEFDLSTSNISNPIQIGTATGTWKELSDDTVVITYIECLARPNNNVDSSLVAEVCDPTRDTLRLTRVDMNGEEGLSIKSLSEEESDEETTFIFDSVGILLESTSLKAKYIYTGTNLSDTPSTFTTSLQFEYISTQQFETLIQKSGTRTRIAPNMMEETYTQCSQKQNPLDQSSPLSVIVCNPTKDTILFGVRNDSIVLLSENFKTIHFFSDSLVFTDMVIVGGESQ